MKKVQRPKTIRATIIQKGGLRWKPGFGSSPLLILNFLQQNAYNISQRYPAYAQPDVFRQESDGGSSSSGGDDGGDGSGYKDEWE